MEIRFFKDPDTGLAHCNGQHGVSEPEVGELFRRGDGTFAADGQTNAGRYLRVIYRDDRRGDYLFVITAYDLKGKALQAYRRRRRRRK